MTFFDTLSAGSFKKDSLGKTLFFPWGIMGAGYIVEGEEAVDTIRSSITRM